MKQKYGGSYSKWLRRRVVGLSMMGYVVAVVTAALLLATVACGGKGEQTPAPGGTTAKPTPTQAVPSGPQPGGKVVLALTHPDTLNPALLPVSTTIFTTPLFFDGLTRPGDDMAPVPDLAESWTIENGGLRYTFNLRKSVLWSDGQPFTADDVKFTWETICHPQNSTGAQICGFFSKVKGATDYKAGKATEISGVKVLDPYTIQVDLDGVYAPFLTISASQLVIPKHLWKDVQVKEMLGHPAARGNGTVGTGPFVVDSWTTNETIVSHANQSYFDGRSYLDQLIIRQSETTAAATAARVAQFKAGQIDAMGLYSPLPIDNANEFESNSSFEVRRVIGLANNYVEFNLRDSVFSDLNVRKAISYATDRKAMWDSLWRGRVTFVNGPVHPVFSWAINPNTPLFDNDLDKARTLFAEAGWTQGTDGILQKGGQKLQFAIQGCCGLNEYGPVLQQQWKRAGIDVQIDFMDFGSFWGPIYNARKHRVAGLNLPYGLYTDPEYPMGGYFTPGQNRSGWNNPRGSELIRLSTSTVDQAERQKYYYELQDLLANDVPNLWLGIPDEHWAFSSKLFIPEKKTGYLTIRSARDWYWKK